jgi:hypothetical protein
VDTAATFRIPKINFNMTRDDNTGSVQITTTVNPMPWTDDWAMLSDGTLAIVRGQDYRVDVVGVDSKMIAGPKLPFEWQRLSDEDKVAIIDSTRTALEKVRAAQMAQRQAAAPDSKAGADTVKAGSRQRPAPDGGGNMVMRFESPGGGSGPAPAGFTLPPLNFVLPSDMPDYRPVFRQGASRGDTDGNLWIRTSRVVNGATEYDVISNKGELKDRVLVPPGRVIAGFGPGGVVYMGVVDGAITRLERARLK